MLRIYGIKNCDSVKKALKFFKDNNIETELFDFKKQNPPCDKIKLWALDAGIDKLFNSRGTTYRTLNLKELNLDETGKIEWLCKESMLIKRPVIEYEDKVLVGFDEKLYKETFL
ncbi:arsenate reductase family protein [Halarcobacter ebronensis]|uniref:Arsenate reductase family protein n=1 Tax=Halarcobacter ebronensis TaxID=1462615 RepID=A0A4Q1APX8_9BACT|nr:Spx/MgsR family RNA polymerase-binding regulatory protein [Halarcobacter ebronensis]QKF83174.1 arsenate reductase (ArsC) family protein [Halarcobacter ebronensis]RXK05188.1 arsenate reductase family protein [Halarcobacter ebronensis]